MASSMNVGEYFSLDFWRCKYIALSFSEAQPRTLKITKVLRESAAVLEELKASNLDPRYHRSVAGFQCGVAFSTHFPRLGCIGDVLGSIKALARLDIFFQKRS